MLDIIKNFTSISAIAAFIFAVTYFIVRLPVYESSNINKTEFNKDTVKGLTIVFIVSFILFAAYFIFSNKITLLSYSYIVLSLGYMILYLHFYRKVENKRKLIVNVADSYIKDKFLYGIYQVFSILIIFITAFIIVNDIYNYYNMKNYILYRLSFPINKTAQINQNNIFEIVFLIRNIILYLITMLAASYIMAYGKLFNFTKYLIFSEKFSDKKILGYLLFENDEEIMVKCDESYPIMFKKADVDNYMIIPDLSFIGEDKRIHINTNYNGIYKDEFVTDELKVDYKCLYNTYNFNKMEIITWIVIIFFSCCVYFSLNNFTVNLIIFGIGIMIVTRVIIFFMRKSSHSKYLYEYNKGNLYYNLCEYEKAVDCYEKAIKLNSHSVYAHKNRCKALFMLDETIESN